MSFWKKLLPCLFGHQDVHPSNCSIGSAPNDIGAPAWSTTRSLVEVVNLRFPPDGPWKEWREIPELKQAGQLVGEASSAWIYRGDGAVYRRILPLLPDIDGDYRDWEVAYCWRARALSAANLKDETYAVLDRGLKVCNRRSDILSTLGDIEFDHRCATCFGWWMQACMLQSSDWVPYLKLSVAAHQIHRLAFSHGSSAASMR